MQNEQKKFQEKLADVLSYAREHGNQMTMEEVHTLFKEWDLDQQKLTFICEYLTMEQVDITDYEAGCTETKNEAETGKKKAELSAEEERALGQYLEELGDLAPLEEEKRKELYQKAAAGDDLAKSTLIQDYLPRVIELAKEVHTPEFFLMDLIQEGNVSLLLALDELSEEEQAEENILQAIREGMLASMEEHRQQKHQDNTMVHKVNRLKDAIEDLSDGDEMDFSVAELSAYLDMSVEEIEDILRIAGEEP